MTNSGLQMVVVNKIQEDALDQARKLLGTVAFEINRVVKSAEEERIHDLRVAIRRFSQLLGLFKTSFASKDLWKIRRRLKRFLAAAGEVRNFDIALKLVCKSPAADSELLRSKLRARRKEDERNLVSALKTWTESKTSLKWRSSVESALMSAQPPIDAHRISEMEREMLSRLAKNFFAQGRKAAAGKGPRQLHDFRITAKKFRYTLELFPPFYWPSFKVLAESLRRTQRLLGDINDCETTREILANYQAPESLDNWLTRRQQKRIAEFRRHWAEQFGSRQAELKWIDHLNRFAGQSRTERKPMESSTTSAGSRLRRAAVA